MNPYDIYGNVVEFRCAFGRMFLHVQAAPRQKHRHRLDAVESVIRDMLDPPDTSKPITFSLEHNTDIYDPQKRKKVSCDRVKIQFQRLNTLPKDSLVKHFPHQKDSMLPSDTFMRRVSFIPESE